VACGDPGKGDSIIFTESTIKEYGFTLLDVSAGPSYVVTGAKTSITLFDGTDCYKNGEFDTDAAAMITIKAGYKQDLSKLPLHNHKQVYLSL